jgi:hypothetical protein
LGGGIVVVLRAVAGTGVSQAGSSGPENDAHPHAARHTAVARGVIRAAETSILNRLRQTIYLAYSGKTGEFFRKNYLISAEARKPDELDARWYFPNDGMPLGNDW